MKKLDKSDALLWAGTVVICGGVAMIFPPAAVILFGMALVVIAISAVKKK